MSRATIACFPGGSTMMPGGASPQRRFGWRGGIEHVNTPTGLPVEAWLRALAAHQHTDSFGMGRGWLGSVPARSAATGPVAATAAVADVQQDSATGTEALRVGWQVYLTGLLGLTLCRAFWGARDDVSCCADRRAVGQGLAWRLRSVKDGIRSRGRFPREDRGAAGSGADRGAAGHRREHGCAPRLSHGRFTGRSKVWSGKCSSA